jgi:hypothetical protein
MQRIGSLVSRCRGPGRLEDRVRAPPARFALIDDGTGSGGFELDRLSPGLVGGVRLYGASRLRLE